MKAKLLIDSKCILGEGPFWHPAMRALFWVDIEGKKLFRHSIPEQQTDFRQFGKMPGAVVPIRDNQLLIAFEDGLATYDWGNENLAYCSDLNASNPMIRANDGKCDPSGNFWIGTMHLEFKSGEGALYRLNSRLNLTLEVKSRTISNGLAWTNDGQYMYYIDSADYCVYGFDFHPNSGNISNRRIAIRIDKKLGAPDGMTIDFEDKLWIAHWGGNCVRRWDPLSGRVLQEVQVPAPHVTSCTFGGQHFDVLYITSARSGLSTAELKNFPMSGGIFTVKCGIAGRPVDFFKLENGS